MVRRNVSILCVQETKWVGKKVRIIESWGYKLRYTGTNRNSNVGRYDHKDVVEIRRKGDKILLVKLVLGRKIFNVISVYAPQVGLDESNKRQFWEDLDEKVQKILIREKLFTGGDLNGHVGTSRYGCDSVHEGFDLGKEMNQITRF